MGITHEWNGTTLIITSDSGTSSADLKGEKGDTGIRGPQGAKGKTGEMNTQVLDDLATKEYVSASIAAAQIPEAEADLSAYYTKQETRDYIANNAANALKVVKYSNPVDLTDISALDCVIECKVFSKNIVPSTANNISNWTNYTGKWYRYELNVEPNVTYSFAAKGDGRTSNYQYLYIRRYEFDEATGKLGADEIVCKLYQHNQKFNEVSFTTEKGYKYFLNFYGNNGASDFFYSDIQVIIGAGASGQYYDYVDADAMMNVLIDIYVNGESYDTTNPSENGDVTIPYIQGITLESADAVTIKVAYNRDISKAFEELRQAIISLGGNI